MTEADQIKRNLREGISSLETSSNSLYALDQQLTEVGADLNQLKMHADAALRLTLTALSALREGSQISSLAVSGSTNPEVMQAMGFLNRSDTDLEDLVAALNRIRQWTDDMQSGPHRTATEERPRIISKIIGAITRFNTIVTGM